MRRRSAMRVRFLLLLRLVSHFNLRPRYSSYLRFSFWRAETRSADENEAQKSFVHVRSVPRKNFLTSLEDLERRLIEHYFREERYKIQ